MTQALTSEQPRRIAVLGAAGTGKTRLTTDLMTAWDSAPSLPAIVVADNPSLALADAPGSQGGFDHALLMGLDLPTENACAPDREAADRQLRDTLHKAALPYTVIYGEGPARLASALDALRALSGCSPAPAGPHGRQAWVWACDTCSDPACERRLLSDLLAGRAL